MDKSPPTPANGVVLLIAWWFSCRISHAEPPETGSGAPEHGLVQISSKCAFRTTGNGQKMLRGGEFLVLPTLRGSEVDKAVRESFGIHFIKALPESDNSKPKSTNAFFCFCLFVCCSLRVDEGICFPSMRIRLLV